LPTIPSLPLPRLRRAALLAGALAAGPAALAQEPADPDLAPSPRRGPAEVRDEQLLAQPRLTLPAISPQTLGRGAWEVRVSALWSNSFAWTQKRPGEDPTNRRFLIDGESFTLDATIRRGLGHTVDVAVRAPVRWRGGGVLDRFIDAWHRVFHLPNADRPSFRRDAFRIEGLTTEGTPFSLDDRKGGGLGDTELQARWRFRDGASAGPCAALVLRASLPTATGPFAGIGLGGAGQVVLDAPLGRSWDLYLGAGLIVQDPGPIQGIEYATTRVHGFAAFEWRPWRRVSLVAETNAASRLVENIDSYPGLHWIVNVVSRIDLARHARFDLGFTENIKDQQATTDFAAIFALEFRP
jgi:hypothetical protein